MVEDNPELGAFVVSALTSLGYRASLAGDCGSGPRSIESAMDIALVLSDIDLLGPMSGHDFPRQARLRRPGLKAILMSGQISVERVNRAELGADTLILPKPFRVEELAAKLTEALGPRGALE